MTRGSSEQQEPVTFVDKRKIDPETGEVREPENGAGTEPGGEAGAAENGAAENGAGGNGAAEAADTADTVATEIAELTADLQRLTAEYANYRRRVERDRKAANDAAKAAVVTELLGVLDDLDRAKAHGDLDSGPLKSVADKLVAALQKQGLEEFGTEGEPFDPTLHEAVQHEGSGAEPVIGVVMRKGYRFGERVLRHALVGVTDPVAGDGDSGTGAETAGKTEDLASGATDAENNDQN